MKLPSINPKQNWAEFTALLWGKPGEVARPVSDEDPLPVAPARTLPTAWTGTEEIDLRKYSSAEIQVAALGGGDTITVSRSLDGVNFVPQAYIAADFSTGVPISAPGIYSFPGGGWLKWERSGSGTAPSVTLRAEV